MDCDPYAVLGLPYSVDEAAIQKAFQEKMKSAPDPELLIEAYGMIRDSSGRNRFRWNDLRHCEAQMETSQKSIDLEALIRELAFLSPWEMGEDSCLN